jgi:hypothetical protein
MGLSDHVAMLEAYRQWDKLPFQERYRFCISNFLSLKGLEAVSIEKRSLLHCLSQASILLQEGHEVEDMETLGLQEGCDGVWPTLEGYGDVENCSPALIAALLSLSYGFTGQVSLATGGTGPGAIPKMMTQDPATGEDMTVRVATRSVLKGDSAFSSPYVVYEQLHSTAFNVVMSGLTPVPPLVLALFGPSLEEEGDILVMDNWFKMNVPADKRESLLKLRKLVDSCFLNWIDNEGWWDEDTITRSKGFLKAVMKLVDQQTPSKVLAPPRSEAVVRESLMLQRSQVDSQEEYAAMEEITRKHEDFLATVADGTFTGL